MYRAVEINQQQDTKLFDYYKKLAQSWMKKKITEDVIMEYIKKSNVGQIT